MFSAQKPKFPLQTMQNGHESKTAAVLVSGKHQNTYNVGITKIKPPVITIDSWYKPFPVMGGLWHCYNL